MASVAVQHWEIGMAGINLRVAGAVADGMGVLSNVSRSLGFGDLADYAGAAGDFLSDFLGMAGMLGEVLLQWGDFAFSIGTVAHQEIARKSEWRWQQQDRLGRKPAQQFVGPGADTITLQGVMLPEFAGRANAMQMLRAQADQGEPQLLMDHFGNVLGLYVLKSLDATGSVLDQHGQPRKITFTAEFVEYGEDAGLLPGESGGVLGQVGSLVNAVNAVRRVL